MRIFFKIVYDNLISYQSKQHAGQVKVTDNIMTILLLPEVMYDK
jgi:hypothetical protein